MPIYLFYLFRNQNWRDVMMGDSIKKNAINLTASIVFVTVLLAGGTAMSTEMSYTATDDGSGRYTLDFTVINDTLTEDIEWLSIYFGETADGLTFVGDTVDDFNNFAPDDFGGGAEPQPTDWFSYSFERSALDTPAQFNSDADVLGIVANDSLSGFTVSFDWTGSGDFNDLYDLYFDVGLISDDWDYTWLDSGFIAAPDTGGGPAPVPEPATMLLFATGLVGLAGYRKKMGKK